MSSESGWVLVDPSGTRLHFFDDGSAVFNPLRWETHVVDLLVGTLLEALFEGPRSLRELVAVATNASDLNESDAERFVSEALSQLVQLDLIVGPGIDAHR